MRPRRVAASSRRREPHLCENVERHLEKKFRVVDSLFIFFLLLLFCGLGDLLAIRLASAFLRASCKVGYGGRAGQ